LHRFDRLIELLPEFVGRSSLRLAQADLPQQIGHPRRRQTARFRRGDRRRRFRGLLAGAGAPAIVPGCASGRLSISCARSAPGCARRAVITIERG
jgi:hypothetical protein